MNKFSYSKKKEKKEVLECECIMIGDHYINFHGNYENVGMTLELQDLSFFLLLFLTIYGIERE